MPFFYVRHGPSGLHIASRYEQTPNPAIPPLPRDRLPEGLEASAAALLQLGATGATLLAWLVLLAARGGFWLALAALPLDGHAELRQPEEPAAPELVERIGVPRAEFFIWGDDVEYLWRAREAGARRLVLTHFSQRYGAAAK